MESSDREVAELIRAKRFVDAAVLLRERIAAEGSTVQTLTWWRELGALCRDALGDIDGAMDAYAGALELDPSDTEALRALADLCRMRGDWRRLCKVLESMAELASEDGELVRCLLEAARVSGEQLCDLRASESYAQRVLDLDPDNAEARSLLARAHSS